eukprot:1920889-Rhodomonas_salina.1
MKIGAERQHREAAMLAVLVIAAYLIDTGAAFQLPSAGLPVRCTNALAGCSQLGWKSAVRGSSTAAENLIGTPRLRTAQLRMADNSGDDEWLNTKVVQQRGSRRLIRNGSGGSQFDIRSALSGETSWGRWLAFLPSALPPAHSHKRHFEVRETLTMCALRFSGLSVMGFKGGTVT